MPRRSQREVPFGPRETRLHIEDVQSRLAGQPQSARLSCRDPSRRRRPLDRPAPFKQLRYEQLVGAFYFSLDVDLDDLARGSPLKGLVDVEIVGVVFVAAMRDRHLTMNVVGRDPERIV